MSIETLTWVLFAAFFICMFLGIPIAFSLASIAKLFTIFQWGPQGLLMSFTATYMNMDSFIPYCDSYVYFHGSFIRKIRCR